MTTELPADNTKPLGPEQVAQFERDGFLMIENLFDAEEVELMLRVAQEDRLLHESAYGRKDASGRESRLSLWNHPGDDLFGTVSRCRRIVDAMEQELGTRLDRFVAVGGATRNEFWMQNKADVVGRPIEVPGIEEATPLGAAVLAGIGVGLYRDEEDALQRVYRPGKTYEPDPALAPRYAEWFQTYKQLYPALAPVSHRLSDGVPA